MSIWIRPTQWTGTIVHASIKPTGDGICWPVLGLTATGSPSVLIFTAEDSFRIATANTTAPLNQWTHIVQTFSLQNGRKYELLGAFEKVESCLLSNHCYSIVRIFVNGSLRGHNTAAAYFGAPQRIYLMVGANGERGSDCQRGDGIPGQFYGTLDEFRLFNRELAESEICALAGYTV